MLTDENATAYLSQYVRWFGRIATATAWEGTVIIHIPEDGVDPGFLARWDTIREQLADPGPEPGPIPFRTARLFTVQDFAIIMKVEPIAIANVEHPPMSFHQALCTNFLGKFSCSYKYHV